MGIESQSESGLGNLGSLAQSARLKHLNQARWILIIVGIIIAGFNAFELANLRAQFNAEVRKKNLVIVNQAEVEKLLDIVRMIFIAAIALGVLFIVLGLLVKTYPVPTTIAGLVLYVLYVVCSLAVDPENIGKGLIIRIFLVVALVRAVQAAFAYQKDLQAEALRAEIYE